MKLMFIFPGIRHGKMNANFIGIKVIDVETWVISLRTGQLILPLWKVDRVLANEILPSFASQ